MEEEHLRRGRASLPRVAPSSDTLPAPRNALLSKSSVSSAGGAWGVRAFAKAARPSLLMPHRNRSSWL
eukprot:2168461-Rhodomonas_salina.1